MIGPVSIEPFLAIYSFSIVIYTSVTPQLLLEKVCLQKFNTTICDDLKNHQTALLYTQKGASLWMMILFMIEMFTSFFGVIIWGPLTDIIGRKKYFIYISAAVAFLNMVLSFSAHFVSSSPSYILIASIASGSFGNIQGVISACYSFMADITKHDLNARTKRMAVLESCIFLSSCVSGLISGQLLSALGYRGIYLINCGLGLTLLVYVLLLYKCRSVEEYESLNGHSDDRENAEKESLKTRLQHINPIFLVRQIFITMKENKYRSRLFLLLVIYWCGILAFVSDLYIIPIYLKNEPFHFTPEWIGYYIAVSNLISGIGVAIAAHVSHHVDVSDYKLLSLGFISQILVYILTGLARTKLTVFLVRLSGVFGFVISTTIRSLVSKLVTPQQYGSAMACVVSSDVAGGFVTNLAGLSIYRATLTINSGIVFFVIASVSFLGLVLMVFLLMTAKGTREKLELEEKQPCIAPAS